MDEELELIMDEAKGELVDLHYFPIKYKGSNLTTEESYVRYNLKNALFVMVQMEQQNYILHTCFLHEYFAHIHIHLHF